MEFEQNNLLEFKTVLDENDVLFHKAFILCCEIFPDMMPYYCFRRYLVSVALLNGKFIGFMLLNTGMHQKMDDSITISTTPSTENSDVQSKKSKDSEMTDSFELASKSTESDDDNNVTLASIGIDVSMRGKKIGDKYIEWLKNTFVGKKIELHVSVNNEVAINLYKKHGFTIDTLEDMYYNEQGYEPYTGKGRSAYIMSFNP